MYQVLSLEAQPHNNRQVGMYCTRVVLSPLVNLGRGFVPKVLHHRHSLPPRYGGAKESVVKVDERPQLELIIYLLDAGCLVIGLTSNFLSSLLSRRCLLLLLP